MTVFLISLLVLLLVSASVTGLVIFRGKAHGLRLLVLAPVPGALVIGILGVAYFVTYAGASLTVLFFVALLVLAAWVVGFLLCAVAVVVWKRAFS